MSLALSSNDAEVISRVDDIDLQESVSSPEELENLYEIEKSVEYIKKHKSSKVALQFPDYLLQDSVKVAKELRSKTNSEIFILADTTYGSYDVDEVAASHVNADLIIHYGKSAFTSTPKTDTFFVFGKCSIGLDDIVSNFNEKFPDDNNATVAILLDLNCYHLFDDIKEALNNRSNVIIATINQQRAVVNQPNKSLLDEDGCLKNCPDCDCKENDDVTSPIMTKQVDNIEDLIPNMLNTSKEDDIDFKGHKIGFFCIATETPIEELSIYYIGTKEGETLRNIIMKQPSLNGFVYDIRSRTCSELPQFVKRKLNQRYFLVEKIKDAQRIGILVGTMGMSGYQEIIKHLKKIITKSGRKCYTIVVGKPNPAKLANFAEMDAYVLVACPEQTFVDEPRDFYQPIATPYEVEVALNQNRQWNQNYITDFREILPGGAHYMEFQVDDSSDISLINGGIRNFTTPSQHNDDISDAIALTNEEKSLAIFHPYSSANFYASSRSWKGLEQNLGKTPVTKAVKGRDGVPISYRRIDS